MTEQEQLPQPEWMDDGKINEVTFCVEYMKEFPIRSIRGVFYTPAGILEDENILKQNIYAKLRPHVKSHISKTVANLVDVLRMEAASEDLPLDLDRIHVANGTVYLDGHFTPELQFCRNRLPVFYDPDAPSPAMWLKFLDELLEPEDIPTVQEYMAYCTLPTTAAQKMMTILGNGGEGKSQLGLVMERMLGSAAIKNSIAKIESNRFARADLENKLLMIDDDLDKNALPKTNNLKTIVTARGKLDLEKKGMQSYQGQLYVRFLCLGNGELTAQNDSSKGFYRRQIVLHTKDPPPGRVDDPFLADKLEKELPGIFLWCLDGLKRLVQNHFQFTLSSASKENSDQIWNCANSFEAFLHSTGYIEFHADAESSSKALYSVYKQFCEDNSYAPLSSRQLSSEFNRCSRKYNLESTNNIYLSEGKRVRGFLGIECVCQYLL